jgi:crotonobetainyl-CoA:carnitine CoA-transferase CaiB-like acyl-CoA transferase
MGRPELAEDPRYKTIVERMKRADEMERMCEDWVATLNFDEIEPLLVGLNVPFGGIYRAEDIARDPHYEARRNIAHVPDDELGEVVMPAVSPRLEGTPGRITHAGPEIGAHTAEIYGGLLGMSAADQAALKEAGVI